MKTKVCFKCFKRKPLTRFYIHPQMLDGHLNKCKTCTKNDAKNPKYKERIKAYDRVRFQMPDRHAWALMKNKEHRKKYPGKTRARRAVGNAIRDGRLIRKPCEMCGAKAQAHHPDYRRPFLIRWLCVTHHHQIHRAA